MITQKIKNLENNDDKMSKWVIYIGMINSMCDIHICVDININVLFRMVNRHAKQHNIRQKIVHKSIEYVKIVKNRKLNFLGSCTR